MKKGRELVQGRVVFALGQRAVVVQVELLKPFVRTTTTVCQHDGWQDN